MASRVTVEEFMALRRRGIPVIDVRSPGEYGKASVPGAVSIPLFTDEERAMVGTIYTKKGSVKAVQLGLEYVGPRLAAYTQRALDLRSDELLVYCWRGGNRSASMGWLFETVGLRSIILEGGYKAYRNYLLDGFRRSFRLIVIGGRTGSGKSDVLRALASAGEQVIDLEAIASHKGSAFGAIGEPEQPSTEYFENMLFDVLSRFDVTKPIWIEDESLNIGKVVIPREFFSTMSLSPMVLVQASDDERLDRIMRDYAFADPEVIVSCIRKIEKRMGSERCSQACKMALEGDMRSAAALCLKYYDKLYDNGISKAKADERVAGKYFHKTSEKVDIDYLISLKNKIVR